MERYCRRLKAKAELLGTRKETASRYVKTDLMIFDEFDMKKLPKSAAEDILEVFHRSYLNGATIIATNRPIDDRGKILGDKAATPTIQDRFLENNHFLKIPGCSYRMKQKKTEELSIEDSDRYVLH